MGTASNAERSSSRKAPDAPVSSFAPYRVFITDLSYGHSIFIIIATSLSLFRERLVLFGVFGFWCQNPMLAKLTDNIIAENY